MDEISDSTVFGAKPTGRGPGSNEEVEPQQPSGLAPVPSNQLVSLAGGRFELRGLLGRGGFAAVYRAYDQKLKREVALKIPHPSTAFDRGSHDWLLREGQATAALKHPQIVTLFDFELTGSSGFLVNELIEGPTLADFIRQYPDGCDPREAAQIILLIADALAHAHSNGVLHRDIKPSNILLDSKQTAGGLSFSPRLSDFGLASMASQKSLTRPRDSLIGSIHYIPPEAFRNPEGSATEQGDIYSLSCILYELLTGSCATPGTTYVEVINRIAQGEITSVRKLRPEVPKDLHAICHQGLASSPQKRYASASGLVEDLKRFLNGVPVSARTPTSIEHFGRFVKRHPAITTACLLALSATLVIFSIVFQNNRQLANLNQSLENSNQELESALAQTDRERLNNERIIYSLDMYRAAEDLGRGNLRSVRSILQNYREGSQLYAHRDVEWHYLNQQTQRDSQVIWQAGSALYVGQFTSDGRWLAVAGQDGRITILDSHSGELIRQWQTDQLEVNGVCFRADDQWIWSTGDDGTVRAWSVETGQELWRSQAFHDGARAYNLAYLPKLDRLVVRSSDDRLIMLSALDGQPVDNVTIPEGPHYSLKASAEGDSFYTTRPSQTFSQYDGETMQHSRSLSVEVEGLDNPPIDSFAISGDAHFAVLGIRDRRLVLVDLLQWAISDEVVLPDSATDYAFYGLQSLDSEEITHRLVIASRESTYFELAITTDRQFSEMDSWTAGSQRVYGLVVSPTQSEIVACTSDGGLRRWGLEQRSSHNWPIQINAWGMVTPALVELGSEQLAAEVDASEQFLLLVALPFELKCIWSKDPSRIYTFPSGTSEWTVRYSTDGRVWMISSDNSARFLRLADLISSLSESDVDPSSQELSWVDHPLPQPASGTIDVRNTNSLTITADGKWMGGFDRAAEQIWISRSDAGGVDYQFPAREVSVLFVEEDGKTWWWSIENELYFWRMGSQEPPVLFSRLPVFPSRISVAADRSMMAVALTDRSCELYRLDSAGTPFLKLPHDSDIYDLAILPSGRTLMTLDATGTLQCWNLATGRKSMNYNPLGKASDIRFGLFLGQGKYLVRHSRAGSLRLDRLLP
jgi:serine/threonine protein kinase